MAKNILICDDAAFMRMMIKDILTKNGYNVAGEAENGAKAVEKYNELKPDLVLMDITMPEMDGIQALKKIKENQREFPWGCSDHVFRNGTAGNGYRVYSGRSQGLYCETVPGRPRAGSGEEGYRLNARHKFRCNRFSRRTFHCACDFCACSGGDMACYQVDCRLSAREKLWKESGNY